MRTIYDRIPFIWGAATGAILVANELRDLEYMPIGGDFSQTWVAGVAVNQGAFATLYSPAAFSRFGSALVDHFYHPTAHWSYPPTSFLIASPLALFPYPVALTVFSLLQIALAVSTAWVVCRGRLSRTTTAAIAMLSPALLLSLLFGQFSIPIACLMILGIFFLETRPTLAGVLFALTIIKPQFAVLCPLALVAAGAWRATIAAAAAGAGICAATTLIFGPQVWPDFFARTLPQQTNMIGFLANYGPVAHSVRDTLLLVGTPQSVASGAQFAAAAIAVLTTASIFWRERDPHLRAFVLTLASVTLLPYANIYDAAIPAMGALAIYGSGRQLTTYQLTAVFLIWLSPVVDGLLGTNGLFKFVPLFETCVLAGILIDSERRAVIERRGLADGLTWVPAA